MGYDLTTLARQAGVRRDLTLRPIEPARGPEQDLARLYLAVLKAWSPEAILRNYTGGLTTDAPSDQTDAIAEAENTVTRLIAEFTAGLRGWLTRVEVIHRSRWTAAVKAGTGIDLSMMLTGGEVQETLQVSLDRQVALVRNISDQARSRISDAVFRGYQERRTSREVAANIREATGLARDRSRRVAADQYVKLSATLDRERQVEAGLEYFKWRSSHKKHARPHHAAREGKIYEIKSGKQRNGDEVIPSDDRAGMPPYCGCRAAAWIPLMEELGI